MFKFEFSRYYTTFPLTTGGVGFELTKVMVDDKTWVLSVNELNMIVTSFVNGHFFFLLSFN